MDNPAGSDDCKTRNSAELRKQLAPYDKYGSVVGDFNRRAMQLEYECDPTEDLSGPMSWYSAITEAPLGGHAYLDAVRHRRSGLSMAQQWTFEKEAPEPICTGGLGIRRMRLDYIFVSDVLFPIEASVDDPGWAGATPGTIGCSVAPACKYSDHRFVAARLRLPGSQPPPPPPVAPAYVDDVATGETTTAGTRSGSYLDTQTAGGGSEVLKEVESGGKAIRRYSLLDHRWTVPVTGGTTVTFSVQATASTSSDGDTFQFRYSVDGGATYSPLLTVASGATGTFSASLPSGTKGQVLVRVTDTDRSAGHRGLDSISVDHLYIRSG